MLCPAEIVPDLTGTHLLLLQLLTCIHFLIPLMALLLLWLPFAKLMELREMLGLLLMRLLPPLLVLELEWLMLRKVDGGN